MRGLVYSENEFSYKYSKRNRILANFALDTITFDPTIEWSFKMTTFHLFLNDNKS